jgi:putative hydrolase of the HAD superfamily
VPRVVLFDLDGTLVDHDAAAATAIAGWAEREGWVLPDLARVWDEVAERHFPAYRARTVTFAGQRRLRLRDFLPLVGVDVSRWDDARFDEAFAVYDRLYTRAWTAYDDAAPALDALPRTAVLSNGDQAQQEAKLRRTGLLGHLDAVLTSDLLGVAKPESGSFRAACAELGVAPADAVYVGDRVDVDARAATAAGLRGVWLNRLGAPDQPGVETISSLAELPALLAD